MCREDPLALMKFIIKKTKMCAYLSIRLGPLDRTVENRPKWC